MTDFLTKLALFGAAATATACAVAKLIIESGKWKMKTEKVPQFSILHSKFSIHTAVFAFFAMIATLSAQKGGTNAPPNGASPPNGNVELKIENVELRNVGILHSPLYILHSTVTNDSYSYAMPTNGTRYARWWKRGAYV